MAQSNLGGVYIYTSILLFLMYLHFVSWAILESYFFFVI